MGKIDLIDNGWVDLVFDGKNQAYGAYQLRKDTGKRNLKALITMFLIFAAIAAIVIAKVSIENYIASQNAAIEADVELQSLAEKKEAKAERKEEPEVEKIEIEQSSRAWLRRKRQRLRERKSPRLRRSRLSASRALWLSPFLKSRRTRK